MTNIDDWRSWLIASDLSPETIRLWHYQLTRFERHHPQLLLVTVQDLANWLGGHDWATNTRRSQRTALRSFYGWAHASGLIGADPSRLLPKIRPPKRKPRPAPERAIAIGLAGAELRVRIMLLLAVREGMRRGEICQVHSDDLIPDLTGWSLLTNLQSNAEARRVLDVKGLAG